MVENKMALVFFGALSQIEEGSLHFECCLDWVVTKSGYDVFEDFHSQYSIDTFSKHIHLVPHSAEDSNE